MVTFPASQNRNLMVILDDNFCFFTFYSCKQFWMLLEFFYLPYYNYCCPNFSSHNSSLKLSMCLQDSILCLPRYEYYHLEPTPLKLWKQCSCLPQYTYTHSSFSASSVFGDWSISINTDLINIKHLFRTWMLIKQQNKTNYIQYF